MFLLARYAFIFVLTFFVAILIAPLVIKLLKKEKAKQTILSYVDFHNSKKGTPTMGGIIIIVALILGATMSFGEGFGLAGMALVVVFAYSLIGFVDDLIKVVKKQNEGLTPFQKLVFQTGIAVLVGFYLYTKGITHIIIPFTSIAFDLSWGVIIFSVFVYLATTNAVNFTDGLDGLASVTVMIFLIAMSLMIFINNPLISADINEIRNLVVVACAGVGALFGFLFFNGYPAKIFMGDTGSLGLGALVATVALFSENTLYILLFGFVFVATIVSVIIQVLYYKKTKKRVFLMSPLHHHYEKKGIHEVKIVTVYAIITVIISITVLLIEYNIKL